MKVVSAILVRCLYLCLLVFSGPTLATSQWTIDPGITEETRVMAVQQAVGLWPGAQLIDASTYLDLNGDPNLHAFVFCRDREAVAAKPQVVNQLQRTYDQLRSLEKQLALAGNSADEKSRSEDVRRLAYERLKLRNDQQGRGQFYTLFMTAASQSPKVLQAYSRLPRHLVQIPAVRERLHQAGLSEDQLGPVIYIDRYTQFYSLQQDNATKEPVQTTLVNMDGSTLTDWESLWQKDSEEKQAGLIQELSDRLGGGHTVVITHGFQSFLDLEPPAWTYQMAQALRDDYQADARLLEFNPLTGRFENILDYEVQSPNAVLIMNWVDASNDYGEGYSEAAGDALFQALLQGESSGRIYLGQLHFIGHSRGTVVNGEAIERLLHIGRPVRQVTTLDPHDEGILSGFGWADYDVNPGLAAGVVSWSGSKWADNYYSMDGGLDGKSLQGTFETLLSGSSCSPNCIGHTDVHEWYLGTIDPDLALPDWWYGQDGRPERNQGGYHHARSLRNGLVPPGETGNKTSIDFSYADPSQAVLNGDFSRVADELLGSGTAGWFHFGGQLPAPLSDQFLVLSGGDQAIHNYTYIPAEASAILYRLEIPVPDSDDELHFSIDSELMEVVALDQPASTTWHLVPLDGGESGQAKLHGPHRRLDFSVDANGHLSTALIRIDDIQFIVEPSGIHFAPDQATAPAMVRFQAEGEFSAAARFTWQFHDGSTAFGRESGKEFRSAGEFDVQLIVEDPSIGYLERTTRLTVSPQVLPNGSVSGSVTQSPR